MKSGVHWTVSDLELLPDDGTRREIIDGELFVSTQPSWYHQMLCVRFGGQLDSWSTATGLGLVAVSPGLVFSEEDAAAPDVVWASDERLAFLDDRGHLRRAPDLVVEVLSPGLTNELRDREAKLKLYSDRGVREYWIADWRSRQVEVYRRVGTVLQLVETLYETDTLTSPLLPGFAYPLVQLFARIPVG